MRIEFNRTGAERKALVKAISEITGAAAVYKFVPTCAYEIDCFTVTKDGALEFDDRVNSEEIENLLERLAERGFTAAAMPDTAADSVEEETAEKVSENAAAATQGESVGLTVAIPIDKVAVGNLTKLLDAKGSLIKKALGITELPIEITEDEVSFPWFSLSPDLDSAKAYANFITALCRMSREQKRINATEKKVTNEKFEKLPSAELLTPLVNPEFYFWKASGSEELLKATLKAYPYPQVLDAVADMSHISIIGIKLLTAEYSGDVGVCISLDDGATYSDEVSLGDWLNTDVDELWNSLPESRKVYFHFVLHDNAALSRFKITYIN